MIEFKRILIIGNSGAGKTWLGNVLSQRTKIPLFHMDKIRWAPKGYEIRRSLFDINKKLETIQKKDRWILEGVFGIMAQNCLPFATLLIWLDLPWEECKHNLFSRGPQFEAFLDSDEKEKALIKLIEWAAEHKSRTDTNSWSFFNNLYNDFRHQKTCLRSREEIEVFLKEV